MEAHAAWSPAYSAANIFWIVATMASGWDAARALPEPAEHSVARTIVSIIAVFTFVSPQIGLSVATWNI